MKNNGVMSQIKLSGYRSRDHDDLERSKNESTRGRGASFFRKRSRLARGPPQIWRVAWSARYQRYRAKFALALRLNEDPDFIRERLRFFPLASFNSILSK